MTEVATTAPVIIPMPASPWEPCDGHAEPTVQAIFSIRSLLLCLNCARKHGFDVDNIKTWLHDKKTEGSDH